MIADNRPLSERSAPELQQTIDALNALDQLTSKQLRYLTVCQNELKRRHAARPKHAIRVVPQPSVVPVLTAAEVRSWSREELLAREVTLMRDAGSGFCDYQQNAADLMTVRTELSIRDFHRDPSPRAQPALLDDTDKRTILAGLRPARN